MFLLFYMYQAYFWYCSFFRTVYETSAPEDARRFTSYFYAIPSHAAIPFAFP